MPAAHIDRLILDVPSMPPAEARRLALLVAAGLAQARGVGGTIASVHLMVERPPSAPLEALAQLIVADALRRIRMEP
jgi:hypothetical protein